MKEDDDYPRCFKCDDECSIVDGLLVCDKCDQTYTQQEWEQANEKEIEAYIAFCEKLEKESAE